MLAIASNVKQSSSIYERATFVLTNVMFCFKFSCKNELSGVTTHLNSEHCMKVTQTAGK